MTTKDIIIDNNGDTEVWVEIGVIRTNAAAVGYEEWVPDEPATEVRGMKGGVEYSVTVDENGDLVETPVED